ncbi:MAG: hypothetical protein CSA96_04430 [Bacteroidetes bacterium]|nr:MAG: hypothetical protein CSA96_04430 [Bacteroidota bacterium]
MAKLHPFKGYRPLKENVKDVASRPYDVLNSAEAREEVKGNPRSFLHVVKPEVDLPEGVSLYDESVYLKGKANLQKLIDDGYFVQDGKDMLYIYGQTMFGRTQYGIVGCAGVDDYLQGIIKKHELTRPDKEEDRMKHIRVTGFNAEPVFFAYPDHPGLDEIVEGIVAGEAEYDFVTEDGVGHHFWLVDDDATIAKMVGYFEKDVKYTYVADGHHRTAAAALVGAERREQNPNPKGNEEYNFFLAVHFPASQLNIIDYNRVVKDLNGLSPDDFRKKLEGAFELIDRGAEPYKPAALHEFSMYLEGRWYSLVAKEGTFDDDDPIAGLDVTILSQQVLGPLLGITDLRKSKSIDFVGGIRGLEELSRRVDSGEMAVAFALYPVSMEQLMAIADNDMIMPPKTTWFEPKLRSGLVIHALD